jgi:hypothetical protein
MGDFKSPDTMGLAAGFYIESNGTINIEKTEQRQMDHRHPPLQWYIYNILDQLCYTILKSVIFLLIYLQLEILV